MDRLCIIEETFKFFIYHLFSACVNSPDVATSCCCVLKAVTPGNACVYVCACMCVSDCVFLSSLQSFSLHLVLIRTNTVEVSGLTAAFASSPCACSGFFFPPVCFHRCLSMMCVFIHYICIYLYVHFICVIIVC